MTIEQRLQLSIGYIMQNPTTNEISVVNYLIDQGNTKEESENALALYKQLLFDYGYITAINFGELKTWLTGVSSTVLANVSEILLAKYKLNISDQEKIAYIVLQNEGIDSDLLLNTLPLSQADKDQLIADEEQRRTDKAQELNAEKAANDAMIVELGG